MLVVTIAFLQCSIPCSCVATITSLHSRIPCLWRQSVIFYARGDSEAPVVNAATAASAGGADSARPAANAPAAVAVVVHARVWRQSPFCTLKFHARGDNRLFAV